MLPGALFLACLSVQANAENFVETCAVSPVSHTTIVRLYASVDSKIDDPSSDLYHSYLLIVELPKAVIPDIHINQTLNVSLPTIHHKKHRAVITNIQGRSIELRLDDQVQQLAGQALTVEVPLRNKELYLIPHESIYAPRGFDPKVFIVKNERAVSVAVGVIQAKDNGLILVSSSYLNNENVICNGLNNLIAGEPVNIISLKGGEL